MPSGTVNEVRRGFYLDSVALMRVARTLGEMPGVEEAALMMGTAANCALMADAGVLDETGRTAGANDLVVAVRATDRAFAEAAMAEAARLLERPKTQGAAAAWRPKTLRNAVRMAPDANLALISVPGPFAAAEARKAIRRGLHAMIFSDNVSVADERALKEEARALGTLVMGPDCGTAIVGGVPLAFANAVPRGDIGIVGASGTGMQEVSSLIAQHGGGVSHALGVGGRDLSAKIGGISTLMAMDMLEKDPATRHVVLISKPPAGAVANRVIERIAKSAKAYTVCFIGGGAVDLPDNATAAATLKAAAEAALGRAFFGTDIAPQIPDEGRSRAVGLYTGGTLCAEAQIVFRDAGHGVASNVPIPGAVGLDAGADHRFIDLGDDEYTQGHPHPMIDPAVRDAALLEALGDPSVAVVLLDIVIGYGANGDPAGHLVALLDRIEKGPHIVASVTGTDTDPQGRGAQEAILARAGVTVLPCNADAAEYALACIEVAG